LSATKPATAAALARLENLGESTELTFTQRTFATKERRALHEQGWTDALDRLQELPSAP
jgi:hypothetical protein